MLGEKIRQDLNEFLKERNEMAAVLRMLTALQNKEKKRYLLSSDIFDDELAIASRLSEEELEAISSEVKKRKESIVAFEKVGRARASGEGGAGSVSKISSGTDLDRRTDDHYQEGDKGDRGSRSQGNGKDYVPSCLLSKVGLMEMRLVDWQERCCLKLFDGRLNRGAFYLIMKILVCKVKQTTQLDFCRILMPNN